MNIRDNYVSSAFFSVPQTILGTGFFFIVAVIFGQVLFGLGHYLWLQIGSWVVDGYFPTDSMFDYVDAVGLLFYSFGCGALSGVGLIFLVFDAGLIYRLLSEDESPGNFIFAVAGNQIGLSICAGIPAGEFLRALPAGVVALLILGLLFYGCRGLKRKLNRDVG